LRGWDALVRLKHFAPFPEMPVCIALNSGFGMPDSVGCCAFYTFRKSSTRDIALIVFAMSLSSCESIREYLFKGLL
jgi:hypothetical protein